MMHFLAALLAIGSVHAQTKSGADLKNPASLKGTAPAVFEAKFTTTKGDFVVQVHRDWAPKALDRFYNLVPRRLL